MPGAVTTCSTAGMRIGVIGLGTMGAPMARHLLDAGHQVAVHNRTRERELPLAELGAEPLRITRRGRARRRRGVDLRV